MENKRKRKDKDEETQPQVSAYNLFTQEYYENKKKKNEPKRAFKEESKSVKEAWNALKDDEKATYKVRAEKLRRRPKGKQYAVPFLTRCAPNQFIQVCKSVKNREEQMERLKRIGFDKLVNICCSQIPRDLCGQFMGAFDPPTKSICIRGRSLHIRREDVTEFMGLPCVGGDIERNAMNEDNDFQQLKTLYGTVPYKTIGKWLIEREEDPDFDFLFVMYALGTLLCPGAGVKVSDRVLKVMVATKAGFGDNDWATFVLTELSNSVGQYKKKIKKGKASGKINVGGCIYFLMVFCLQQFPLGELQAAKNDEAIGYWNDKNVKQRVKIEKQSNHGLLHSVGQVVGGPASEVHKQSIITHPEIRRTYERIMSRVVSIVQEELVSLEARLLGGGEMDGGEQNLEDEKSSSENEDEQPSSGSEDEMADTGKGEHDEVQSINEEEGSKEENEGEANSPSKEGKDEGDADVLQGEQEVHLRKSTRVKKPALVSPWVTTMAKKRTKDDKDKEALYQLCTTRPKKEDAQE